MPSPVEREPKQKWCIIGDLKRGVVRLLTPAPLVNENSLILEPFSFVSCVEAGLEWMYLASYRNFNLATAVSSIMFPLFFFLSLNAERNHIQGLESDALGDRSVNSRSI
jgi:hypothetical protein